MYGVSGKKTEEYKLRNKSDNFEQGAVDKFKVGTSAKDLGKQLGTLPQYLFRPQGQNE